MDFRRSAIESLSDDKLRSFLETNFFRVLPSPSTLATTYSDWAYQSKYDNLKEKVSSFDNYYISFDETEFRGEKYYSFLIGELSASGVNRPYLIETTRELESPNTEMVQQKLMKILSYFSW